MNSKINKSNVILSANFVYYWQDFCGLSSRKKLLGLIMKAVLMVVMQDDEENDVDGNELFFGVMIM